MPEPKLKASYLDLERHWLRLAEEAEGLDQRAESDRATG
jgi:hypothetical protein